MAGTTCGDMEDINEPLLSIFMSSIYMSDGDSLDPFGIVDKALHAQGGVYSSPFRIFLMRMGEFE